MRGSVQALVVTLLTLAAPACRCGNIVSPVDAQFRVDPQSETVDFGRVLEGETRTLPVTLVGETRAAVSVTIALTGPFTAQSTVEVAGGSTVDVPVTFHAGNTPVTGTISFTGNGKTFTANLLGTGVRPLVCVPSKPCVVSVYSLDADACIETASPDDAACEPTSQCLVQGRCRDGECLGVTRSCDDNNKCTVDACSMSAGCVHTMTACPAPTNPCHVATCDPVMGCGETNVPDGIDPRDAVVCGAVNCDQANVCVGGQCTMIATPEGFPCSPAVACLAEAECHNKVCVRPDAGLWVSNWSTPIDGEISADDQFLERDGTLFFTACHVSPSKIDAGADGGLDAGSDGGRFDAGADAGAAADAGAMDAGAPLSCALESYTGSGFDRFITRFTPGTRADLVHIGFHGVVLTGESGLALSSSRDGTSLASLSSEHVSPRVVATVADGGVVFAETQPDGGVSLRWWSMVLTDQLPIAGDVKTLAVDARDTVWSWNDSDSLQQTTQRSVTATYLLADAGGPLLMTSGRLVVAGDSMLGFPVSDGGYEFQPMNLQTDGGRIAFPQPQFSMMTNDATVLFDTRCHSQVMSCPTDEQELWARSMNSVTGLTAWETRVLHFQEIERLVETQAVRASPGSFVAVIRREFDGGVQTAVRLFANGISVAECVLPAGSANVTKALFTANQMITVVSTDGGSRLEAWPLNGLPMSKGNWSRQNSGSGERRSLP